VPLKYFYMSRTQRHIKKQSNITNEESYAILQKPTNATFISKETVETNAKTEDIRQAGEVVYVEPKLVEDTETEGQKKAQSFSTTMENETNFYAETYV
jgi:hypothetical protein